MKCLILASCLTFLLSLSCEQSEEPGRPTSQVSPKATATQCEQLDEVIDEFEDNNPGLVHMQALREFQAFTQDREVLCDDALRGAKTYIEHLRTDLNDSSTVLAPTETRDLESKANSTVTKESSPADIMPTSVDATHITEDPTPNGLSTGSGDDPVSRAVPIPAATKAPVSTVNPLVASAENSTLVSGRAWFELLELQDGSILAIGGQSGIHNTPLVESWNPTTGNWNAVASMNYARKEAQAVLLSDGKVLVVGGSTSPTAEIYDPPSNSWKVIEDMVVPRSNCTMTRLFDGRVLIVGGVTMGEKDDFTPHAPVTAEIYEPDTGEFRKLPDLKFDRNEHTATLMPNGTVVIIGGANSHGYGSLEVERFDPVTESIEVIGKIQQKRIRHSATLLSDGAILIRGGYGKDSSQSAERFDPNTGSSKLIASNLVDRSWHVAITAINGEILIVGGTNSYGGETSIERWDSMQVMQDPFPNAQFAFKGMNAVRISDGRVMFAGGWADQMTSARVVILSP